MFSDIKITIQGYAWNENQIQSEFWKVSFFNPAYNQLTEAKDVTPYVIQNSISELTFSLEETFAENGNDKFFKASDFSFSVSDISDFNFQNFFRLQEDTTYVKFLVRLYYKNKLQWCGCINQGLVNEEISDKGYAVNVTAVGLEKEFQEYYLNVKVAERPILSNLFGQQSVMGYGVPFNTGGDTYVPRYANLDIFLFNLLGVTNLAGVNVQVNIKDLNKKNSNGKEITWRLVDKRHLYLSPYNEMRLKLFKNSFEYVRDNGETVWGLFTKLCNAMGWVFWFKHYRSGTTDIMELVIKNRYTTTSTYTDNTIVISNDDLLIPLTLKKRDNKIKFPYIQINDGAWRSVDKQWFGSRCFVISNNSKIPLRTNFFSTFIIYTPLTADVVSAWKQYTHQMFPYITIGQFDTIALASGSHNNFKQLIIERQSGVLNFSLWFELTQSWVNATIFQIVEISYMGADFVKLNSEDNNVLDCTRFYSDTHNYNQTEWNNEKYFTSTDNVLRLDAGNSDFWRVDKSNLVNYYPDQNSTSNNPNDFDFSGNYGNMLFYNFDALGQNFFNCYCYGDYVQGVGFTENIFEKNMKSLLQTKNNIATRIKINRVETDINKRVYFDNTDFYAGKTFSIQELKIDYVNDVTTFELINLEL